MGDNVYGDLCLVAVDGLVFVGLLASYCALVVDVVLEFREVVNSGDGPDFVPDGAVINFCFSWTPVTV